jgi:hypothetical protein
MFKRQQGWLSGVIPNLGNDGGGWRPLVRARYLSGCRRLKRIAGAMSGSVKNGRTLRRTGRRRSAGPSARLSLSN